MSTIPHDDGGPAFPSQITTEDRNGTPIVTVFKGMTLRDYFAAKAMAAMVAGHLKHNLDPSERGGDDPLFDYTTPDCEGVTEDSEANAQIMAETAYQVADAMLAARKGGAQ